MEEALRRIASRLANLKTSSGPETTPLTFAVGAVFALLKAEELHLQFGNEPDRALRIWAEASRRFEEVGTGGALPISGEWLAGYYYNDGIIRIAVAFEHLVRHETNFHDHSTLKQLQAKARENEFRSEWLESWGPVFDELNAIRHRNKEFDGPTVEPERAIKALTHLTEALEWACARRAQKAMEMSV